MDMENLNQYLHDLSSSSPFMAEALVGRISQVNERWQRLLRDFEEREVGGGGWVEVVEWRWLGRGGWVGVVRWGWSGGGGQRGVVASREESWVRKKRVDGRLDGWMEGWMGGWVGRDWMDGWKDGWVGGWVGIGWMEGWVGGWVGRDWMDGWKDGWVGRDWMISFINPFSLFFHSIPFPSFRLSPPPPLPPETSQRHSGGVG